MRIETTLIVIVLLLILASITRLALMSVVEMMLSLLVYPIGMIS